MKLQQLDLSTLDFFSRILKYGLTIEFHNTLVQMFYRSGLQSLIAKVNKAKTRIRKALTLKITLTEAICLFWTLEFWNEALPDTYAVDVLQKYFVTALPQNVYTK